MASRPLNQKQLVFIREFVVDLNATQAAIRAGYSAKTAGQIGGKLLKKAEIQEAIQQAIAERSERTQVTADRVVRELAFIAFEASVDAESPYRAADKIKSLELLGRHLAMFVDKQRLVDGDGNDVLPSVMVTNGKLSPEQWLERYGGGSGSASQH